jgi:predicted oxidoreductase
VRPAINHTLGGVVVDGESCQAMDGNGQPIKGLYAAGTVMNWACGRSFEVNGVTSFKGSYHAGATSGAGIALMSGRLAAQKALDKIRKREVG